MPRGCIGRGKPPPPADPQAYRALGLFYASTGERDKAIAEFRSVASSKPKDASVAGNLVELLLDANQVEEAKQLNEGILKVAPDDSLALTSGARILIAERHY